MAFRLPSLEENFAPMTADEHIITASISTPNFKRSLWAVLMAKIRNSLAFRGRSKQLPEADTPSQAHAVVPEGTVAIP